jgi:hypothetical protein
MTGEQLPIPGITTGLKAAEDWRRANPLAYAAIISWEQADAARFPKPRCSMQRYYEWLRCPAMVPPTYTRMSVVYAVDHRLRRPITDLVMSEYPSLPFKRRKSMYDAERGTYATPAVMS